MPQNSTPDGDRFATTARYYAAHRPGYSDRIFAYLGDRFDLGASDRVLDLGCGTGEIAVPIADQVGAVVAMDPEPAMLTEVERRAATRSDDTITVREGSDADLPALDEAFDLVCMGRSFHWMDQDRTLEEIWRLLPPGGGIAILGNTEWVTRGTQPWQDGVYDIVAEHLDEVPDRTGPVEHDDPWDEKIDEFGFVDVTTFDHRLERSWTPDEIVGYLFSLSFCAPEQVGDRMATLEADVRTYLAGVDGEDFAQTDCETVISGFKPTPS